MTVTRRAIRIGGCSPSDYNAWHERAIYSGQTGHVTGVEPNPMTTKLNSMLAPAERIVSVTLHDGDWYIFTESFGLGPATVPIKKGT